MRRRNAAGHAVVELALIIPWTIFLFAGALDWGYFAYALISTQSAVRVAAEYTSSTTGTAADATGACNAALGVMRALPNVGSAISSCGANPLTVSATSVTGPDGAAASLVSVSYQTVALIPIPGLLPGQITVTRSLEMRVRG